MTRFTAKYVNGRWWEREEWDAMVAAQQALRPKVPYIISDRLDDVICPLNGRPYDSKSAYYQTVKDAGCEIAGSDPIVSRPRVPIEPPGGLEKDIKTAMEMLSAGS